MTCQYGAFPIDSLARAEGVSILELRFMRAIGPPKNSLQIHCKYVGENWRKNKSASER
jgi:hypothetical protein